MTRSGDEYVRGLRDGRTVLFNGERVADVTAHPAFAAGIRTVAALYDLAHDPANRELMTYPSPRDGHPINKSWLVPRTREDLAARRRAIKCWADASYGFLGRSPDHVASFFAGFAGSPAFYARGGQQFADNLVRFAAKAADEDLYISYVIVHPTVDRAKPAHQQAEPHLYASAAAERDNGIIIRGAQMLGTASVMSDYVLVTVILPLKPGDEDYAISCVMPTGTPGLKLYPRRPYALGPTSVFDYPLSSRFDETDSLVVFDDVFVPWEDVFIYKNIELTAGQFSVTAAHVLGNTQSHIRSWAKLEFLVGLVKRCMDLSGRSASSEMIAHLGDLASTCLARRGHDPRRRGRGGARCVWRDAPEGCPALREPGVPAGDVSGAARPDPRTDGWQPDPVAGDGGRATCAQLGCGYRALRALAASGWPRAGEAFEATVGRAWLGVRLASSAVRDVLRGRARRHPGARVPELRLGGGRGLG